MSYPQTRTDYSGGYPQYSESDIIDFITNGADDINGDAGFSSLEGAEDMIFGGFGHFDPTRQHEGFGVGLTDSTDGGMMMKTGSVELTSSGAMGGPTSQHAAFLAQNTVGVSSFGEHNARSRLERHQQMIMQQQQPVTPLRDTPHTPTNIQESYASGNPSHGEMRGTQPRQGYGAVPMAAGMNGGGKTVPIGRGFGPGPTLLKVESPSTGPRGSNTHGTLNALVAPSPHLIPEDGVEVESTELHEFIAPGSLETDPILNEVSISVQTMQREIDEMRLTQTATLQAMCENLVSEQSDNAPHISNMEQMIEFQTQCLKTAGDTVNTIFELQKGTILTSAEVERASTLADELNFITANLQVMLQELTAYLNWVKAGGEVPALEKLTALVISRGPFPSIWMKRNQMSEAEAIYVKLIHGCSVTLASVSEVRATIHCHTAYTAKTTPAKPIIDFDSFPMDPATLMSSCQFVFTAGSRKDVAQCRFTQTIQGVSFASSVLVNRGAHPLDFQETCQITSPDSKPFIVITNECQYGETFGILFQKDVFQFQFGEPQSAIPWPLFANSIQRYFIRSSRQDPVAPKRGLSVYDLEHIHAHFFHSNPVIDVKSFQKFWDWYGKVLHRMRYQRHVAALWMEGLIFGMVSREGVCEQLISRQPGTFLLRFSESSAGFIAVGYRVSGANAGIKNYLVKQEDTASATVKTLPDFLRSRPEFSVILQYTGQHLEDGFPVLYPIHKDFALKAYCAARPSKPVDPKAGSPYDEL